MGDQTKDSIEFKMPAAHYTFIHRVAEKLNVPLGAVIQGFLYEEYMRSATHEACRAVLEADPDLRAALGREKAPFGLGRGRAPDRVSHHPPESS